MRVVKEDITKYNYKKNICICAVRKSAVAMKT